MSFDLTAWRSLLLREWMQHQRGWFWLLITPVALALIAVTFGQIQLGPNELPMRVFVMSISGAAMLSLGIGLVVVAMQAPGLARRDSQDRSIEFWRSLPVGDAAAVAAPLLMHFWLFPLLALTSGVVGGLLLAPLVVLRGLGHEALWSIPWLTVVGATLIGAVRLALGVVLGMLWMAPLLLVLMAASAWLKRWGVPVLVAAISLGGLILKEAYGQPWLYQGIAELFNQGMAAIFPGLRPDSPLRDLSLLDGNLAAFSAAVAQDLLSVLGEFLSPWALVAAALSVAGFWLLWLHRQRAA